MLLCWIRAESPEGLQRPSLVEYNEREYQLLSDGLVYLQIKA